MTSSAAISETETVVRLPVAQCFPSATQPRKRHAKKLDPDFVESIRQKGVRQPIVVRERAPDGWEIVFGHRRHEGSVIAGLETIPAIVRNMTDEEVFEDQLIENMHREEMHPLDEADGFLRMLKNGRSPQQISEKVGRPLSYVSQRLKLCEIAKETRDALDKDKITLGVAIQIARLPQSLQEKAVKSLTEYGQQPSVDHARRHIADRFMLRLDQAPFDITSADLVPKAGSCTACPKRTGAQREIFADVAGPDLCIDRGCYEGKKQALWQIRVKDAKKAGRPVLEGKAAEKALGHYKSGYTKLDQETYIGGKYKKPRTLFGKGELPPVTLAFDKGTGELVELIAEKDFKKASRKYGKAHRSSRPAAPAAAEKRRDEKGENIAAAVDLAIVTALERIERVTDSELLRILTEAMISLSWEGAEAVVKRRQLEPPAPEGKKKPPHVDPTRRLAEYLKTLTDPEDVAGLALELALREAGPDRYKTATSPWTDALKLLGIKFQDLEKKVATEAKAKKEAEKTAKLEAKKKAKADAKAKGAGGKKAK